MRPFDAKLLSILSTETEQERRLKLDPLEHERFAQKIRQESGSSSPYAGLKNAVSVSRILRYVHWPVHRCVLLELTYVVSGSARMWVGKQSLELRQGDLFLPNQYSELSLEALGDGDILLNFIMKPRFIEDFCVETKGSGLLTEFMIDTLRKDISWNRYLHFTGIENLSIHNLIEAMAYTAFPYLNDHNIMCGSEPDPEVTEQLTSTLLRMLARNLGALETKSPTNFEEVLRQTVCHYIASNYRTASLKELALQINQSESALSRQIKAIFGFTFKELLLQKRFERSVVLLQQTNLPIGAIAEAVGYENTSFFYRRFQQYYGISPKDFRK